MLEFQLLLEGWQFGRYPWLLCVVMLVLVVVYVWAPLVRRTELPTLGAR